MNYSFVSCIFSFNPYFIMCESAKKIVMLSSILTFDIVENSCSNPYALQGMSSMICYLPTILTLKPITCPQKDTYWNHTRLPTTSESSLLPAVYAHAISHSAMPFLPCLINSYSSLNSVIISSVPHLKDGCFYSLYFFTNHSPSFISLPSVNISIHPLFQAASSLQIRTVFDSALK